MDSRPREPFFGAGLWPFIAFVIYVAAVNYFLGPPLEHTIDWTFSQLGLEHKH